MIYLAQEHIQSSETSELDFQLYDDFGLQDKAFDEAGVIEIGQGQADGEPVLIDSILQKLNELKSLGCNYVGLEHHCDHHGYIFSGYQIRLATKEEVATYEQQQDLENIRNNQINALYQQIKDLRQKPL